MSEHESIEENNIDEPIIDKPTPPDKMKVALFFGACFLIILVGVALWWQSTQKQDAPPPSPAPIATTTQTGGSSSFNTSRTFDFTEPDIETPPPPPAPNTEPEKEERETPPPPPNGKTDRSAPKVKTVVLDKSAPSSRSSSSSNTSGVGGGLGIVPPSPTQTTDAFNAFTGSGNQGSQNGLGQMLKATSTPNSVAGVLYNRDYLLPKGAYIDCVLNTSLNSTVAGMSKCTLTRNIYSDNGTTLLLERGSEVTGEYRSNLAHGQSRLFVLWDRVKTPHGVIVDLSSPATDSLGAGGVDGYVETHFWKRFGGAMMLSLVDDFAAYVATNGGNNVNNFESSSDAAQQMATEALKHTINIPPTFYKNQGERVGIFVARDIDFSTVYQLRATR